MPRHGRMTTERAKDFKGTLRQLLAAFPNKYQIKRYEGKGGATIIAYKCL